MSELMIFRNQEFGSIRTVEVNGEPWMVGKDVAAALGYSNTKDALAKHVDPEDKGGVANRDPLRSSGNDHHKRERPLRPGFVQQASGGEEVPAVGDQRGAALHPQDRRLSDPQGLSFRTPRVGRG